MHPSAKADLSDIWQAETRDAAEAAMDTLAEKSGAKYDKAVTCLTKDREALLAFYAFPAEHWDHVRTVERIPASDGGARPLQRVEAADWAMDRGGTSPATCR